MAVVLRLVKKVKRKREEEKRVEGEREKVGRREKEKLESRFPQYIQQGEIDFLFKKKNICHMYCIEHFQ